VRFLPEIALCVNTVGPSSLPAYITPFDVWFGREPHWLTERTIGNRPIIIDSDDEDARDYTDDEDDSDDNSDDEYPETDDEAKEYILTAIEQRIKANNAIFAEKMVRKSKKQAVVFEDGSLVTLAIPAKIRLSLEPKRLLCRIIQCVRGRYTLTFKFGRIKGSWTASELNGIDTPESGRDIPSYWPDNGPTTPLTQAVQLSNYRGTVPSMRKPNRDVTTERTKALALAAKALEVVASFAPPLVDDAAAQLALEFALEVAQEAAQDAVQGVVLEAVLPNIGSGNGLGRELGTRKRKRTAKAVAMATASASASAPARSLRSSGGKRQKR
jgi:hypothetical protein